MEESVAIGKLSKLLDDFHNYRPLRKFFEDDSSAIEMLGGFPSTELRNNFWKSTGLSDQEVVFLQANYTKFCSNTDVDTLELSFLFYTHLVVKARLTYSQG